MSTITSNYCAEPNPRPFSSSSRVENAPWSLGKLVFDIKDGIAHLNGDIQSLVVLEEMFAAGHSWVLLDEFIKLKCDVRLVVDGEDSVVISCTLESGSVYEYSIRSNHIIQASTIDGGVSRIIEFDYDGKCGTGYTLRCDLNWHVARHNLFDNLITDRAHKTLFKTLQVTSKYKLYTCAVRQDGGIFIPHILDLPDHDFLTREYVMKTMFADPDAKLHASSRFDDFVITVSGEPALVLVCS